MNLRIFVVAGIGCAALFSGIPAVHASGGYSSGGFNVPTATRVDREAYETGRRIYTGVASVASAADNSIVDRQEPVLRTWQDALPTRQQRNVDLTGLAGRLSSAQLDALGVYLYVRFAIDPQAG